MYILKLVGFLQFTIWRFVIVEFNIKSNTNEWYYQYYLIN